MKKNTCHKNFRLNGKSFASVEELINFSKTINKAVFLFLSDWFATNDYVVVQTSGSTGKPKPISLKKEFMINSAKATGTFFGLQENTTALLCLSADYIAGKMMLVRALTLGWHLDVVPSTSNVTIEKQYDFSAMVPMQLRSSLEDISKIKKLIVGGGVVANDLIKAIQDEPTKVYATYGMTETITHIAIKSLNHKNTTNKKDTYKTLPKVRVLQDERNCLVIDAPKVSLEKIVTNDVVCLHSETEFEWLGRYDNVINSGGIKLHPEKIEEKLLKIISNRFFVAGIPDKTLGERLILVVEGIFNKGGSSFKTEIESLQNLSKYETPKAIYFVEKFVETETKKIQRKKTLDLLNI